MSPISIPSHEPSTSLPCAVSAGITSDCGSELDRGALLKLTDSVRDEVLPRLGVRLEDRGNEPSVWKLDDPETIMKDIKAKQAVRSPPLPHRVPVGRHAI